MSSVTVKQKNVERLIARCENILAGKTQFQGKDWRLSKYVSSLSDQIQELEKFPSVDRDLLNSFRQRASVLHEVIRMEQQSESSAASSHTRLNSSASRALSSSSTPLRPLVSSEPLPLSSSGARGSQLLLRASSKRDTTLREQLMGVSSDSANNGAGTADSGSADLGESIDSVLTRHRKMQDEIAEDMVQLARSIRHNATIARDIVIDDNKALKTTNKMAEDNIHGVEQETERLKEHTRGCAWGVWIMLVVVFAVFIGMVLFIRIVPKPSYS